MYLLDFLLHIICVLVMRDEQDPIKIINSNSISKGHFTRPIAHMMFHPLFFKRIVLQWFLHVYVSFI